MRNERTRALTCRFFDALAAEFRIPGARHRPLQIVHGLDAFVGALDAPDFRGIDRALDKLKAIGVRARAVPRDPEASRENGQTSGSGSGLAQLIAPLPPPREHPVCSTARRRSAPRDP